MNNVECKEIVQLISPFIDGELTEQENSLVTEHIQSCQSCNNQYMRLSETVKIASSLPQIKVERAPFLTAVRKRIDSSSTSWFPQSLSAFRGQLTVATLSVAFIAALVWNGNVTAPVADKTLVAINDNSTAPVVDKTLVAVNDNSTAPVVDHIVTLDSDKPVTAGSDKKQPVSLVSSGTGVLASYASIDTPKQSNIHTLDKSVTDSVSSDNTNIKNVVSSSDVTVKTPVSSSGIDWNNIDLRKTVASSSVTGSGQKTLPPVYTSFEQINELYSDIARDFSGSQSSGEGSVDAAGFILVEVNDQSAFYPSFYKHLLNDEDFVVQSIAYNQYADSFVTVHYKGGSTFDRGFRGIASRIDRLDSVVGILSMKAGNSGSSLIQLTVRAASKIVDG